MSDTASCDIIMNASVSSYLNWMIYILFGIQYLVSMKHIPLF